MNLPLHELQDILLDWLAAPGPATERTARLDEQDWQRLMAMVREHRLGPWLHWRLGQRGAGLPVPAALGEELAASHRAAVLRALLLQRELVQVHRLLAAAGIPAVALKGAYLAFHAYPNPALRPLRDLDILVPRAQAAVAYETLRRAGCTPFKGDGGDLGFYLGERNHLPPLRSASGKVAIELHLRLSHHGETGAPATDLADAPGFWQRLERRGVAGETLLYPSPTDLLLHLATHAAYQHTFDNGPLLLADVAFLLASHEIDWPLFWHLAEAGHWRRGCLLTLAMVERHFGRQPIRWPEGGTPPEIPDDLVTSASRLCLRSLSASREVHLTTRLANERGLRARLDRLIGTCFPSRQHMERYYGARADSPTIVFHYGRRLVKRSLQYATARLNPAFAVETRQVDAIQRWLG